MGSRVLALTMLLLIASAGYGQIHAHTWTVQGCLVDRTNNDPLMFAEVVVLGIADTTVADGTGCFKLELLQDPRKTRLELQVSYIGYELYNYRIRQIDLGRGRTHRIKPYKFDHRNPPVQPWKDQNGRN